MAEFKLVISDPKARRAYQIEIKSPDADRLIGKKIGDIIKGELINIPGFEFKITGGSDKQGFPMRPDIPGTKRIRALLSGGPGIKIKRKGERRRKSVRGNQISEEIVQINMKVVKYGNKSLAAALGKEEKEENESAKKEEK
ncbi:MAG: 30S ribosomal protein S6e [Nanoarchaeota archaeon]|nr:30S ribosomal protein S6e [Nanoarchaeota archaeon]